MAMPVIEGVGAQAAGQAAITPAFPSGYTPVAGHIGVILRECDNADAVTVPSGWTEKVSQGVASGTTTKLSAIWRRLEAGDAAPSCADAGNHQVGRMIVVSGCVASGDPFNAFVTSQELTSDTSVSIPGVTTTAADCLILAAFATGQDANNTGNASGWANANLANVAEQMDNWTAQGGGGGFAMATGEKAAAGATGTTTATVGTANFKALMTIALEGAAASGVTVEPATIAATATVPAVTVVTGATVEPATIATSVALPAPTVTTGGRTAPTYPASQDLAEGTGTRSFTAVTTQAGDWLVVEVEFERDGGGSTVTASGGGLTYTPQNDTGSGSDADARIHQITAPDAAGGSRTVQVAPGSGTINYRARLTVVRGSDGPGSGKATSKTAQTVSVARQDDNSGMFMAAVDFSTGGTLGTPTWTPGGTTVAAQDGSAADYAFGRWDDSGTAATESHGVATPTLTTPVIAVLEMLGTGATGDATASPDVIAATAALPGVAVHTAAAPSAVAASTALAQASVSVAAAPAATAATAALPQPVVSVAAAPAVIPVVVTLPQALPDTGGTPATASPDAIACTVTLPAAAVSVAAAPAAIPTAAAVPTTMVGVGAAPAVIPVTVTLPDRATSVGAAPTTVAATVTLPAPTVSTGGASTTASPAVIAATVTLPAALVGVTATPTVVQSVVSLPQATPTTVTTTAPEVIPVTVVLPQPAVGVGVAPAAITVTVTLPRPTAGSGIRNATSTAAVAAAVASVAAVTAQRTSVPTVSGG